MKVIMDFFLYIFIFYKKWKVKEKNITCKYYNVYLFIFYTFLLSFSIEILQPLINGFRSSDITDIITNVIWGAIGYIVYLIFKPFIIKMFDYIKNK